MHHDKYRLRIPVAADHPFGCVCRRVVASCKLEFHQKITLISNSNSCNHFNIRIWSDKYTKVHTIHLASDGILTQKPRLFIVVPFKCMNNEITHIILNAANWSFHCRTQYTQPKSDILIPLLFQNNPTRYMFSDCCTSYASIFVLFLLEPFTQLSKLLGSTCSKIVFVDRCNLVQFQKSLAFNKIGLCSSNKNKNKTIARNSCSNENKNSSFDWMTIDTEQCRDFWGYRSRRTRIGYTHRMLLAIRIPSSYRRQRFEKHSSTTLWASISTLSSGRARWCRSVIQPYHSWMPACVRLDAAHFIHCLTPNTPCTMYAC